LRYNEAPHYCISKHLSCTPRVSGANSALTLVLPCRAFVIFFILSRQTGHAPDCADTVCCHIHFTATLWQCKLLKKIVKNEHSEMTHYQMTCDQLCRPYARQHVQHAVMLIQTKFTVNTSSLRAASRCCNVKITALLMFIIHRTSDRCCDTVGQFSYANC
jgi:hypothetical protein